MKMENSLTLLYAALKTGFIKNNNVLNAYYSLVANIIITNRIETIDENEIALLFEKSYGIPVTIPFIRQVLGVGLENGSIETVKGQYKTNFDEAKKQIPSNDEFDSNWGTLVGDFLRYARKNGCGISKEQADNLILEYVTDESKYTLRKTDLEVLGSPSTMEYVWYKYIEQLNKIGSPLFEFVALLNLTSIFKGALFYNIKNGEHFKGLSVYLDTPLIFAILGMDSDNRKTSYLKLIEDAQKEGCCFYILDNNYYEAMGIITRASQIAFSNSYKISKANKVAQFFHNTMENELDAEEYISQIEKELNSLNIFIKTTNYDINENIFQEDENQLFEMVCNKYRENGTVLTIEREQSIHTDVRSIIMVYRERKGKVSTSVAKSQDIFITINSAIANVSKLYESNKSINAGHIPAAISADLLGTLIWLYKPNEIVNYRKKQLLADCYSAFQPSKELLEKYLNSLDDAKMREEIDENKYLFLRNHPLVSETLMNVINGDYSRFSDRTYNDVYNEIVEMSRKEYTEEKERHQLTKNVLEKEREAKNAVELELIQNKDNLSNERKRSNAIRAASVKNTYTVLSFFIIWIPTIVALALYEWLTPKYMDYSKKGFIYALLGVVVTIIIIPTITKVLKERIYNLSEKIVDKQTQKQIDKTKI